MVVDDQWRMIGMDRWDDLKDWVTQNPSKVNETDPKGRSLLMHVIHHNRGDVLGMMDFLIKNGADINLVDYNNWTPLHVSVNYHWLEKTALLIKSQKNPYPINDSDQTPLHLAAMISHLGVVQLFPPGDGVDFQDDLGATALHYAARSRHLEMVKHIVSIGARLDLKDNNGETPLDWARDLNAKSVVRFLEECAVAIHEKKQLEGILINQTNQRPEGEIADELKGELQVKTIRL